MAGILYYKKGGTIILKPKVQGEDAKFYTPIKIMEEVISSKRRFGHFNPKSDFLKKDKIEEVQEDDVDYG